MGSCDTKGQFDKLGDFGEVTIHIYIKPPDYKVDWRSLHWGLAYYEI
jgi:hypothetical protein